MPKTTPVILHIPTDRPYAIVLLPLTPAAPQPARAKRRTLLTTAEVISDNVVPFRRSA